MVLENKIDRFLSKLEMGKSFFEDAAMLLVQMIDEEPDVCQRIVGWRKVDWLTMDVLSTFEAIGRKQLSVDAMFLPKHIVNRMISLPVDTQAQIAVMDAVPVLRQSARRKTDSVALRPVERLTKKEAALVIGPTGIRTIEEQRTIRDSQIVEPEPEPRVLGYYELTVMNGKPFLKHVEKSARAQRVILDQKTQAVLEVAMPS